jgi:hypothetical protein
MTRYSLDWRANWLIIGGGKSGAGGRETSCAPACMAMGAHREKPDLVLRACGPAQLAGPTCCDSGVRFCHNGHNGRSAAHNQIVTDGTPY